MEIYKQFPLAYVETCKHNECHETGHSEQALNDLCILVPPPVLLKGQF
jgi:hypothetical protein